MLGELGTSALKALKAMNFFFFFRIINPTINQLTLCMSPSVARMDLDET